MPRPRCGHCPEQPRPQGGMNLGAGHAISLIKTRVSSHGSCIAPLRPQCHAGHAHRPSTPRPRRRPPTGEGTCGATGLLRLRRGPLPAGAAAGAYDPMVEHDRDPMGVEPFGVELPGGRAEERESLSCCTRTSSFRRRVVHRCRVGARVRAGGAVHVSPTREPCSSPRARSPVPLTSLAQADPRCSPAAGGSAPHGAHWVRATRRNFHECSILRSIAAAKLVRRLDRERRLSAQLEECSVAGHEHLGTTSNRELDELLVVGIAADRQPLGLSPRHGYHLHVRQVGREEDFDLLPIELSRPTGFRRGGRVDGCRDLD
jgi:hypothetical protein